MTRFRRLRAMLVIAVASGIAWVPLGIALSSVESLRADRGLLSASAAFGLIPLLFTVGTVCGFLFSFVLALGVRTQRFAELTFAKVSALGAIGAAVVPTSLVIAETRSLLTEEMLSALAIYGSVGVLAACSLLAVARHAPDIGKLDPPEHSGSEDRSSSGTV